MNLLKKSNLKLDLKTAEFHDSRLKMSEEFRMCSRIIDNKVQPMILAIADKFLEIPGQSLTDLRTLESCALLLHVEQQIQLREAALEKKLLVNRKLF